LHFFFPASSFAVSEKAEILKKEYEKLAAFRYALRRFLRFSEHAAKSHQLTPQQHQALLAIEGFPGRNEITISELKERLQLEHHSTVELVNRLATRKFLVRKHSTRDKREVYVHLTRSGRTVLKNISTIHSSELKSIGQELIRLVRALE